MQDKDKIILSKIIARIETIMKYCNGYNYYEFEENTMLTETCVFNILQIGELSKKGFSDEFRRGCATLF